MRACSAHAYVFVCVWVCFWCAWACACAVLGGYLRLFSYIHICLGFVYSATGEYSIAFFMCGAMAFSSAIILFAVTCMKDEEQVRLRKERKLEDIKKMNEEKQGKKILWVRVRVRVRVRVLCGCEGVRIRTALKSQNLPFSNSSAVLKLSIWLVTKTFCWLFSTDLFLYRLFFTDFFYTDFSSDVFLFRFFYTDFL